MADMTRVYAGTQEGLFVVRSSGGTWETVNRVFPNSVLESVSGCRGDPRRVYAGVAHDGLYRTEDGGLRWTKVFDGDVRATSVDPTDDNVVYTGTEPIHLYRSEDRGETWEELTGLQNLPDEAKNHWWFPVEPHIGHVITIFVHPEDPTMIYLALEHGGIVRSFDRGETWEDVSKGIDYLDIHVISSEPHRFDRWFVSSARGFYASDDPAEGWTRAEDGFTRDYFHDFIFFPPERVGESPTMLIATADKSPGSWNRPEYARSAVFRSDDGAKSWRRVGTGLDDDLKPMVWALVPHPTDRNAAFAGLGHVSRGPAHGPSGPGSLLVTRDRGESWQRIIDLPGDRVLWAATE
ncbi:MAG: hypothetical protein GEU73_14810 [Chloroflexi bacterium]|nr:hypothetical protein [Chloroflexota bacterium]